MSFHERYRRAFLSIAFVLFTLLPIAISTAAPKNKLDRAQQQLDALRQRLQRHESQADRLKRRIGRLGVAITEAQIAINDLDADIARIRAQVGSARARKERTEEAIRAIENLARIQAVELYKAGSTETLGALLEARSVSELNDRIEMLGLAAQKNTGALVRYGRLRLHIQAQNRILFAREAELARTRGSLAEVLERRNRLRSELRDSLRRLNRRIGSERTREGHLEKAAAILRKKILAAQARSAALSLGTSTEGFIWPLNGPVTSPFGSRWGGTHTGIDIDGYTGQPIVAAKSGNVIYLGAGMSGYGNAIVLDHGGGFSTLYAHLSGYEVSGGAGVQQGEVVGYVGCTGNCYGDHLHFEVRINGAPANPLDHLP